MTAQWQPIETAPKDGTDVLLYLPKADPPVRVGGGVGDGGGGAGECEKQCEKCGRIWTVN